jgi:hypothetical protein
MARKIGVCLSRASRSASFPTGPVTSFPEITPNYLTMMDSGEDTGEDSEEDPGDALSTPHGSAAQVAPRPIQHSIHCSTSAVAHNELEVLEDLDDASMDDEAHMADDAHMKVDYSRVAKALARCRGSFSDSAKQMTALARKRRACEECRKRKTKVRAAGSRAISSPSLHCY